MVLMVITQNMKSFKQVIPGCWKGHCMANKPKIGFYQTINFDKG